MRLQNFNKVSPEYSQADSLTVATSILRLVSTLLALGFIFSYPHTRTAGVSPSRAIREGDTPAKHALGQFDLAR
jgi:hypothetical protein